MGLVYPFIGYWNPFLGICQFFYHFQWLHIFHFSFWLVSFCLSSIFRNNLIKISQFAHVIQHILRLKGLLTPLLEDDQIHNKNGLFIKNAIPYTRTPKLTRLTRLHLSLRIHRTFPLRFWQYNQRANKRPKTMKEWACT